MDKFRPNCRPRGLWLHQAPLLVFKYQGSFPEFGESHSAFLRTDGFPGTRETLSNGAPVPLKKALICSRTHQTHANFPSDLRHLSEDGSFTSKNNTMSTVLVLYCSKLTSIA